jgi:hypothetical protein
MDPLSISASVAGLLAISGQIISVLVKLGRNIDDAPESIQAALFSVKEMDFALQSARKLLSSLQKLQPARRAMVEISHLVITITQSATSFARLQALVCPFDYDVNSAASAWLRLKWVTKEDEISNAVRGLESHKSSLSLLLNILQW